MSQSQSLRQGPSHQTAQHPKKPPIHSQSKAPVMRGRRPPIPMNFAPQATQQRQPPTAQAQFPQYNAPHFQQYPAAAPVINVQQRVYQGGFPMYGQPPAQAVPQTHTTQQPLAQMPPSQVYTSQLSRHPTEPKNPVGAVPSTQHAQATQPQVPPAAQPHMMPRKPPVTSAQSGQDFPAQIAVPVANQQTLPIPQGVHAPHASRAPRAVDSAMTAEQPSKPPVAANLPMTQGFNGQSQPTKAPAESKEQKQAPTDAAPKPSPKRAAETKSPQRSPEKKSSRPKAWTQFTGPQKSDPVMYGWAEKIRMVVSGGTVQLALCKPPNQQLSPPKLLTLVLAGVKPPRVARREEDTDEPFAFEAREFVRQVAGGRPVYFAAWDHRGSPQDTSVQRSRFWGDIYFQGDDGRRKSLSREIVAAGYADHVPNRKLSEKEASALLQAQIKAQKRKAGKWNKDKTHVRKLRVLTSREPREKESRRQEATKWKGKNIPAVVETVVSGTTLRVEMMPQNSTTHFIVFINVAGAASPRPDPTSRDEEHKKIANFAKEFTAMRLNAERVTVRVVAIDKNSEIYAQVIHPKGRIGVSLLRKGLAEYQNWTAKNLEKKEQQELKEAAKQAREEGLALSSQGLRLGPQRMKGSVCEIISGDTVRVKLTNGKEDVFSLSSVSAPKPLPVAFLKRMREEEAIAKQTKNKKGGKGADEEKKGDERRSPPQSPQRGFDQKDVEKRERWAPYAREFLRKRLIGKTVDISLEYTRQAVTRSSQSRGQKQKFASIYVNKENVAVSLVAAGLARVVQPRPDKSHERAEDFLALCDAEYKAGKRRVGLHSPKLPKKDKDYSVEDLLKLPEKQLNVLRRSFEGTQEKGVVEFVWRGDRMKVYFPARKCYLPVTLAEIYCEPYRPPASGGGPQATKAGTAAYNLVKSLAHQRDCVVEIKEMDIPPKSKGSRNNPNATRRVRWLGTVTVGNKDLRAELVRQGLAFVNGVRVEHPGGYDFVKDKDLTRLEKNARRKELGVWAEKKRQEAEQLEKLKKQCKSGQEVNLVVSHIASSVLFWANLADSSLEEVEKRMAALGTSARPLEKVVPKRVVGALFDGLYCRARVLEPGQANNTWRVVFLDYGNREWVEKKDMVELPQDLHRMPPLAIRCHLAGMRAPPYGYGDDYRRAGNAFADLTLRKELRAMIVFDDIILRLRGANTWYVELFDGNASVNEVLLQRGNARLDPKCRENPVEMEEEENDLTKDYLRKIRRLRDESFEARVGMWVNGDINSGDDDW